MAGIAGIIVSAGGVVGSWQLGIGSWVLAVGVGSWYVEVEVEIAVI